MKKYVKLIPMSERKVSAYWISPKGKILPMDNSFHIQEVINNPPAFGYSEKEIVDLYDSYGEEIGVEGKAREDIMQDLFKDGWFRIRNYNRPDRWIINVSNISKKAKDIIRFWSKKMIDIGHSKFDDVIIDLPSGRKQYSMQDLSADILYMENHEKIPKERVKIVFVENVFEL